MGRDPLIGDEALIHRSVSLTRTQWATLGKLARDEQVSRSVLVRRAIDQYLLLRGVSPVVPEPLAELQAVAV